MHSLLHVSKRSEWQVAYKLSGTRRNDSGLGARHLDSMPVGEVLSHFAVVCYLVLRKRHGLAHLDLVKTSQIWSSVWEPNHCRNRIMNYDAFPPMKYDAGPSIRLTMNVERVSKNAAVFTITIWV